LETLRLTTLLFIAIVMACLEGTAAGPLSLGVGVPIWKTLFETIGCLLGFCLVAVHGETDLAFATRPFFYSNLGTWLGSSCCLPRSETGKSSKTERALPLIFIVLYNGDALCFY